MKLFFWKNNAIIDTFASELASELYSAMDPETVRCYFEGAKDKKSGKKTDKKMDNFMQDVIKKIRQFKMVNQLGVYGKARLHLKFKLRLEELGYESSLINKINEMVMLRTP